MFRGFAIAEVATTAKLAKSLTHDISLPACLSVFVFYFFCAGGRRRACACVAVFQMGEVMDANEVLTLTCQRLKDEAGRPQDFSYGDLAAVKQAQAGEVRTGRQLGWRPLRGKAACMLPIAWCEA